MPTHYESDNNEFTSESDPLHNAALWDLICVYADGEASADETARVEALLLQHPSLTEDLGFLLRTSTVVRALAEVDPPSTLRNAIYERTTGRPTLTRRMAAAWTRLQTAFAPRPAFRLTVTGGACLAAGLTFTLLASHAHAPKQAAQTPHSLAPRVIALASPAATATPAIPDLAVPTVPELNPERNHAVTRHSDVAKATPERQHEVISAHSASGTGALASAHSVAPQVHLPTHTPQLRTELPSEPKKLFAGNGTPSVRNIDYSASDETAGRYSHLPMMDQANQRVQFASAPDRSNNDSLGANIDTSHDDAAPAPEKKAETAADDTPKNPVHVVRVAQLPPDARHYITAADIKRDMEARNLGFSRITMEGIKRQEATVALIGGKF